MSEITITIQELQYNFLIGFVSGFAASIVVGLLGFLLSYFWRKLDLKKKFGKLEGTYKGYVFKEHDKADWQEKGRYKWELEDEQVSKAEIKYEGENKLLITLTHNLKEDKLLTWEGRIIMEVEKYGTISFLYVKGLQEGQLRFGFKRCIVSPEGDKVFLIGEESEGYSNEVLIRDKANNRERLLSLPDFQG